MKAIVTGRSRKYGQIYTEEYEAETYIELLDILKADAPERSSIISIVFLADY